MKNLILVFTIFANLQAKAEVTTHLVTARGIECASRNQLVALESAITKLNKKVAELCPGAIINLAKITQMDLPDPEQMFCANVEMSASVNCYTEDTPADK